VASPASGLRLVKNASTAGFASFREVVAAAKSTVQIYCDGYKAALGTVVREDGYVVTKSSELKGKIECLLHGRRQNEKLGHHRRQRSDPRLTVPDRRQRPAPIA
jgi:hypothetical protein